MNSLAGVGMPLRCPIRTTAPLRASISIGLRGTLPDHGTFNVQPRLESCRMGSSRHRDFRCPVGRVTQWSSPRPMPEKQQSVKSKSR